MIIVYCETCGTRVSEEALSSGQAAIAGPSKYYCDKCAPASTPTMNRKSPGGSNRLAALMHKAAAAAPSGSNSRTRASKAEKAGDPVWMYVAGGVALLAGAIYFFWVSRTQNSVSKKEPSGAKTEMAAPAKAEKAPAQSPPPQQPIDTTSKASATPAENKAALNSLHQSDPDLDRLRSQRGMKLVDEARAWAAANPNDPWGYKDRLTMVVNIYRSTPAAEEAAKILVGLKIPDGPRPSSAPTPAEKLANPFPPSDPAEGWQPIFDGKTLPFRANAADFWRVEGGALVARERVHQQTNFTFSDGEIRVRFVLQDSSFCQMYVRQSSTGYSVGLDRRVLEPLWGKPMELVFKCYGPDVTATLNGQPVDVNPGSRPEQGHIQFNNVSGTARIFGLEYRAVRK